MSSSSLYGFWRERLASAKIARFWSCTDGPDVISRWTAWCFRLRFFLKPFWERPSQLTPYFFRKALKHQLVSNSNYRDQTSWLRVQDTSKYISKSYFWRLEVSFIGPLYTSSKHDWQFACICIPVCNTKNHPKHVLDGSVISK